MDIIRQAEIRAALAWERIDQRGFDPYGLEHPNRRTEPCRRCGKPRHIADRPGDDFRTCRAGQHGRRAQE
jgi:hypothetical protein